MDSDRRKAALKRWSRAAKPHVFKSLACQLGAAMAWVGLAWSIAALVAGIGNREPLMPAIAIGAGAAAARALFIWAGERAADQAGRAMIDRARRDILGTLARDGAGLMTGAPASVRGSQLQDRTGQLFGYAARWLPGMYLAVLTPTIMLAAVASQSYLAAILLSVSVLTLPLFIWLTASGTAAAARAQQASLDTLSGVFQSRAAQVGLIKAFRAVAREEAVIAEASDDLRQRTMSILRIAFLSTAVLEFFASVSIALVAVYIGFKLLGIFPFETGETVTLREGLMALILAPEFFAPIRRLSSLHHDRANGSAAAEEVAAWMAGTEHTRANRWPALKAAPVIVFDHAILSRGDRDVVRQLSFIAEPGRVTALSGPSGSGKTSCLQALLGYVDVRSGAVTVDGRPLLTGDSLAESIAFVRQSPWVLEGTIADNLRVAAPGASREDFERALHAAGLGALMKGGAGGLDRPLGRFGSGLSGGQRQRLALARALLRDAPILLLDEPTAHLDAETEARFIETLAALKAGRTVLLASHRPAVLAVADTLVDLGTPMASEAA